MKRLLLILSLLLACLLPGWFWRHPDRPVISVSPLPRENGVAPLSAVPAPPGPVIAPEPETAASSPGLPPPREALGQQPSALAPMAAFQKWSADYVSQPAAAMIPEGVKLAGERRAALRSLIQRDPEQALANAVPEAVRRALPAEVQALLEEKLDARGDLIVTAASAPDGQVPPGRRTAWMEARLPDGRRLEAFVYGNREFQPSRAAVPIHGIAVDGLLAVHQWPGRVLEPIEAAEARQALGEEPRCPASGKAVSETGTETAVQTGREVQFYCGPAHAQQDLEEAGAVEAGMPPGLGVRLKASQDAASGGAGQTVPSLLSEGDHDWTTGTKRILVVRVKFEFLDTHWDYTDLTSADCEDIVDGIRNAYLDWSYGRLVVRRVESGGSKVSPVVLLDRSAADYAGDEIDDLWDEVRDKVQDAHGINPDNYDFLLVLAGDAPITDENDDTQTVWWGGLGRIGEGLSFIRMNDPSWTTQERIDSNVSVSLHEIGHNFGLYHSSNLFLTPQFVDGVPAVSLEYGDRYDRMGKGGGGFNVRYKQWLDWLDNGNVPLAVSDGVYTLREHDLEEKSGVRGLQVSTEPVYLPFSGYKQLFVEYRQRGVESVMGYPYIPYNDTLMAYGAQIRLGKSGSPKTWMLDATPETPNWHPVNPVTQEADTSGNWDSPLLPGRTFSWTQNGSTVYITNLSADPESGELKVELQHGPVAGNDPPAGSITVNTPQGAKNQNIVFTASVTDPEDSDLAYHWQIPGFNYDSTHPAIFPNARSITVKFPDTGTWSVKCLVSDKHGGTVALTKSFSVIVNQPPVISSITDKSTDEDVPLLNIPFTVSDATTPAGSLAVTAVSSDAYLFPAGSITLGGSGGNRTLSLAAPTNRHGEAEITVTVSDGSLQDTERFIVTVVAVTPGTTLIASGGNWRFRDSNSPPDPGWIFPAFNDSAWGLDNARFVYPAPLFNVSGWTVLASPLPNYRTTCYFRRSFTMPASPTGTPTMKFLCDDGLVVYVNGVERWRHNMPDGAVSHTTRAASSVQGALQTQWHTVPMELAWFHAGGSNTVAVEVHDASSTRGGGDVVFDFSLELLAAPAVSNITDNFSPEDTLAGAYSFTAVESESPAASLTYTAVSSNQALVLDSNIKVGFNFLTLSRYLTVMPQPDATGVAEITLKVSDGDSETWEKFNLTITPVNDPPYLKPVPDMAVPLGEIAPLVLVEVGDVDSPLASLTVTAASGNQALLPNAGIQVLPGPTPSTRWLRCTPNAGIAAQANVTVSVSDGAASSNDVFIFRVTLPLSPTSTDITLVQSGETWRYWAAALPADPRGGTVDFTDPSLDDRAWPSGPSQLGYGNDGEATSIPVTPYRVTTYLRRRFTVPNAAAVSQLKLRMLRDDGVVVYLNGTRIWTSNMPRVSITASTLAENDIAGAAEDTWQTLTINANALVNGSNTLAVELHQSVMPAAFSPGDLSFDFEMAGVAAAPLSPDTLIPPGSMWAYWDKDIYPDSTWKLATFAEDDWKHGLARLGYGIGGESTVVNSLNTAGTQRNPAVLFRKTFDVADPASYTALHLFVQRDDGISVHLNGIRVHLENLATTASLADLALTEAPSGEHTQWKHYLIDPKRLLAGTNLLAVEIHQSSLSGTDLNFDLQLIGDLTGQPELFMRPVGNDMELSWPAAYNGWNLLQSANLDTWNPVPQPPLLDGAWIYVIQPNPGSRRFYRLEKQ